MKNLAKRIWPFGFHGIVHPSGFLLAIQFILLALYAIFDGQSSQRALISATGLVTVMWVVWVVRRSPGLNWVGAVLGAPAFILSLATIFVSQPILLAASGLFSGVLYLYAAGSLIAYMMADDEVTTDELYAVAATFTLLAWGYAYLFLAVQVLAPGSFVGPNNGGRPLTFLELLFVSVTNLTATGFSDIVPASPWARVLSMIDQFSGVLYVAMVVSRLVGLTSQRLRRKEKE